MRRGQCAAARERELQVGHMSFVDRVRRDIAAGSKPTSVTSSAGTDIASWPRQLAP